MKSKLLLYTLILFTTMVNAQPAKNYAILLQAETGTSPAYINLKWQPVPGSGNIDIYRKLKSDKKWGDKFASLPADALSFKDSSAELGVSYEYFVSKADTVFSYINAGIQLPQVVSRGVLLLLIDENYAIPLLEEIEQLKQDMTADGWGVLSQYVSRTQRVTDVKKLIKAQRQQTPQLKALYLLGHIAVPYSGGFKAEQGGVYPPDGHPDHGGAWPTDMYYGSFNEDFWTDNTIHDQSPARMQNHNVPGDGKFDQMYLAGNDTVALQIGRVDLTDMPLFGMNDTLLTRQYLNKAHAFKTGEIKAERRALIDDHFGTMGGEAFSATGWRTFTGMFGDSVFNRDYVPSVKQGSYLFTYGCGAGTYTSCSGVATSQMLNNDSIHTVFTMLFGSYFGDWASTDNLLRAPLCSRPMGLAGMWSGRPYWQMQHMTMGENIGYSTMLTQNNYYTTTGGLSGYKYNSYPTFIHASLMGDPTLRLHPVQMPKRKSAMPTADSLKINISWVPSPDATNGYLVFRSVSANGHFHLVKALPATDSSWLDETPWKGMNHYLIKAVKLEETYSGSYYNTSLGVADSAFSKSETMNISDYRIDAPKLNVFPNPSYGTIQVDVISPLYISVFDINGKKVAEAYVSKPSDTIDLTHLPGGLYVLNAETEGKQVYQKLMIQH